MLLVKLPLLTSAAAQEAEFRREIDNTWRTMHPNVVRMMGVCEDGAGPTYIVLDRCKGRWARGVRFAPSAC
jgi:hypothetical protein